MMLHVSGQYHNHASTHLDHSRSTELKSHQHPMNREFEDTPNHPDHSEPDDYDVPEERFGFVVHHDYFMTDGYKATQSTQESIHRHDQSGARGTHRQNTTLREGCGVVTQHEHINIKPHQSPAKSFPQHPITEDSNDYVITHLTQEDYDSVKVNPLTTIPQ